MRRFGILLAQLIFGGGTVVLVFFGGLFLGVEAIIKFGTIDQAIAFFPYFQVHQPLFLNPRQKISTASLERLSSIYANSTDYYHYLIDGAEPSVKSQAIEKLYHLDPWQRAFQDPVTYYLEQEDWGKVEALLNDLTSFMEYGLSERQFSKEEILYKHKNTWAKQLMLLAEHQVETGRLDEAVDSLTAAQYFDEWILAHTPFLPIKLTDLKQRERLLLRLVHIKPEYWANYREDLGNMWLELIVQHLAAGDWGQPQLATASWYLLNVAELRTNLLWERSATQELPVIQAALDKGDFDTAQQRAEALMIIWREIDKHKFEYTPYRDEINVNHINSLAQVYEDLATKGALVGRYDLMISLDTMFDLQPERADKVPGTYLPMMQRAADRALGEEKIGDTITILRQMRDTAPEDYWVLTQLGQLYIALGQYDNAKEAFIYCRNQLDYHHSECENSLKDMAENKANHQRYYQVSNIIQGISKWQDFTLQKK